MSSPLREGADMADATFGLRRYGPRYWAVYERETLLCVTVYKKGARTVAERLNRLSSVAERRAAM